MQQTKVSTMDKKMKKGNKYTREDFLKSPQVKSKKDKLKKEISNKKRKIVAENSPARDNHDTCLQNTDPCIMSLLNNISSTSLEAVSSEIISYMQTSGNHVSALIETLFYLAMTDSNKSEDIAVLLQMLHRNSGKLKLSLCKENFRDVVSSYCKSMFLKYFVIHNSAITGNAEKTHIFTKRRILNITVTPPGSDPVKLEHRFNIMKFFGHLFIRGFFLVTYVNFMLWRLLQNRNVVRVYSECALTMLQVIIEDNRFLSFGINQYLAVIFDPSRKFWSQYWIYNANRETWTKFLENENVKKFMKDTNYWHLNPPVYTKVESLWSREKERKAEKKRVFGAGRKKEKQRRKMH